MLNRICLSGRLVADPELRQTQTGKSVAGFRIAVDRNFAGSDGQRQADFFSVTAWGGTADFISNYFSKGNMIIIDGRLQSRNYQDKNGNNRTAIEVVADNVNFCGSKQSGNDNQAVAQQNSYQPTVQQQENQSAAYPPSDYDGFQEVEDTEDLPF